MHIVPSTRFEVVLIAKGPRYLAIRLDSHWWRVTSLIVFVGAAFFRINNVVRTMNRAGYSIGREDLTIDKDGGFSESDIMKRVGERGIDGK